MIIASEKNVEKQKRRETYVIFSQEGQEQDNYVNKTELLMVILEYIIRNTVPGITPINVTNYSILNIPKKMLFFKVLQSKAELKIKIHPLVINRLLNLTSLKNITSSAYLPPEEIFILGLYVLRELDQLHFPLSLEKTLHTGCLFVCTLHKNHSAKDHQ